MTSASRMTFAFSRDGAIPGSERLKKLTRDRVPANAVMMVGDLAAAVITLPALIEVNIGTPRTRSSSRSPSTRSRRSR